MTTLNIQSIDLKSQHNLENQDLKPLSLIAQSKFPVYLVSSNKLKKNLALKVFPSNKIGNKCYKTESRIGHLNNENIINIVESYTASPVKMSDSSYIMMEYAALGDLGTLLIENKLPKNEKMARTLFKQIVKGVEYLHSQGVAHLDLKPDNILLTETGKVKIADFDCCHINGVDAKVTTGGTQNYRAPEVSSFQCENSKAADIYSLGIVMFALRTGMVPYMETGTSKNMIKLLKLAAGRSNDFWSEHNKVSMQQNTFTKEFKELFWMLTEVLPEGRLSLEKISEHAWMQGPIYTNEELIRLIQ